MGWVTLWRDTDKTIERDDQSGAERTTYTNPVEDGIRRQAAAALKANRTFLAIATPTNAQTLEQVKALTRQVNALIRMELDDYSADA